MPNPVSPDRIKAGQFIVYAGISPHLHILCMVHVHSIKHDTMEGYFWRSERIGRIYTPWIAKQHIVTFETESEALAFIQRTEENYEVPLYTT